VIDIENIDLAKEKILKRLSEDADWAYPYWIDEVKEEFPDFPEDELDQIYFNELKAKVDSLNHKELTTLLAEQNELSDANQNFFIINLIEERLAPN